MPSSNSVILATAGSGKTRYLVKEAMSLKDKKVLMLTYTNENLNEIKKRLILEGGFIPDHIVIQGWFSFLLKEGVRPFQRVLGIEERINAMQFEMPQREWFKRIPKTDVGRYYLTKTNKIYRDRISDFIYSCSEKCGGQFIKRLEKMYTHVFIDEVQDITGWDLEILSMLLKSKIIISAVGDVRQATLATTNSTKNFKYRGEGMWSYFEEKQEKGLCKITINQKCYRSVQSICNFSDSLFPSISLKSQSENKEVLSHSGIFYVKSKDVGEYLIRFKPQVLRYTKSDISAGDSAINVGVSKGQTYDHVLIYPTGTVLKYLKEGKLTKVIAGREEKAFDITKLYVAVTRARFSVAFVFDDIPFSNEIQCYKE